MTYLQFHFIFTIPLFLLLLFVNKKNKFTFSKKSLLGCLTLALLALFYTTPWDSYLIRNQIWGYPEDRVLFSIFYIPIEEYFFFIIQTIIATLIASNLIERQKIKSDFKLLIRPKDITPFFGIMAVLTVLFFLTMNSPGLLYLKLIIFWSLPVVLLQWTLGYKVLLQHSKLLFLIIVPLTLYLWVADSVAIHNQIWTFPENTISGVEILGILPIEEALFFLMTNIMVAQGYVLFTLTQPQLIFKKASLHA